MNTTLINENQPTDKAVLAEQDLYKDIFHQNSGSEYANAVKLAQERVSNFLKNTKKPFTGIRPAEMKTKIEAIDFDSPLPDYESLLNEVDEIYVNHATAYHLPEYIAHLNCPVVIPALAAEVLISAINSSQDTYDQSAGGTFMERKLIDWTSEQIGYKQGDGIFTAGGSQSNLMGLLLARDYYSLEYQKWNIKLDGLPVDASKFRVFVSDKAHFSNHKNAWILGLGEQAIVHVGVDKRYRMDPEKLEKAIKQEIEKGNIPIAITATAGTTDFGNVDPLKAIAEIANRNNIWLHVDAAYGCGLLLTEKHRHLLNGIELADSVTIDYHKSFFQPISSSAFIVKNKLHLNIIKHHADYLNPKEQNYDALPAQINKSIIQSTRRFDALKLWFTLRYLGKEKLGQFTDTIIETTQKTAAYIESDENFELLCHSDMGVLVFRYLDGPAESNSCEVNQYIKEKLFFSGDVLVASTKVNGEFYLKFTIFNPITTLNDIKNILNLIKQNGNEYHRLN
ncbi:L-2,4-diaminobutyrate decarboxylase [Flavobacterium sp. 90]|uniref:pyridoxal phosphate-dependent decarboxylase family protein n=1 Tax=unclassified Flavobacterium TaxID=196869 RepID=UPI000EAF16DE|nr:MULTISPECIES: aspartate aminotransferase family protein [unclassified Flavobacterium]RKR04844.1 L-2,4-diaminobutyrate decarboxylase [Flavobacterium sp. 81]TCK56165.1 L-2,4-diaminobutyrate decarboxylase [Flavobacterium sp. 90]